MKKLIVVSLVLIIGFGTLFAGAQGESGAQRPIRLVGATHLPADFVFYRMMEVFGEKVKEYYDGPLEVELHHSGDLGQEKDFCEFMIEGISVDFAISAPSWAATWDKRVSFMDPPFLFKDLEHWDKALAEDAFEPIKQDLIKKGLRIIGYGGGGTRNLILNQPVRSTSDFPKILLRVMGSPIQANSFNAVGFKATPLDYLEVYNGIKTGVVDGLENESAALRSMKFYEVAPNIVLTRHAITVRPLFFSEKRFQSFPKELQDAILKAGEEAAAWHRATETREDAEALKEMAAEGKIKLIELSRADLDKMQRDARPVLEAFAKEIGAEDILANVDSLR
jgi:TRAP-type C4-dicarboxylate transport system substrate-binding protein